MATTTLAPVDPLDIAILEAAMAELTFAPTSALSNAFAEAAQAADERGTRLIGTVYLLHFDRPYRHAAHYTGWTTNLHHRLTDHRTGHGARLLSVVTAAGIGWQLARTWPNTTSNDERALKVQGGASRRCPLCGIRPRIHLTGGAP